MLFIYFESRSDLFKLEKLMRRPRVRKAHDIGSWIYVLEFMAITSIFTNIVLFTFASNQIDYLIPFLKKYRDDSVQSVATTFAIEHAMLLIVILLRLFLDKDPAWVGIFKKRQGYQKDQKTLEKQSQAKAVIYKAMTSDLFKRGSTTASSESGLLKKQT